MMYDAGFAFQRLELRSNVAATGLRTVVSLGVGIRGEDCDLLRAGAVDLRWTSDMPLTVPSGDVDDGDERKVSLCFQRR